MKKIAKTNLISFQKGLGGGFFLTKENKVQKLIIVVEEFDGLEKFNECVMGLLECNPPKPFCIITAEPLKAKFFG